MGNPQIFSGDLNLFVLKFGVSNEFLHLNLGSQMKSLGSPIKIWDFSTQIGVSDEKLGVFNKNLDVSNENL